MSKVHCALKIIKYCGFPNSNHKRSLYDGVRRRSPRKILVHKTGFDWPPEFRTRGGGSIGLESTVSTHNISVSAIKNFLRPPEVSRLLENTTQSWERWHDFETSEVDFGKILTGSVSTAPYFFYASYALDSTCAVFPWSWRSFYI